MKFAEKANEIFDHSVRAYHETDNVDALIINPYEVGSIEAVLFDKNHIDAVQWHLEDIIRDPDINPEEGMAIKRRIDKSNQDRTDLVEEIDSYFRDMYKNVLPVPDASLNTESPAWAIDRLSILALKIWHMAEQVAREDISVETRENYKGKLAILNEQRTDLTAAIDALLEDIEAGKKYMKVYRQMKLYNDPATNPVLYGKK